MESNNTASKSCIGIDPGGERALGWAVLTVGDERVDSLKTGCCTGVDEAVRNMLNS